MDDNLIVTIHKITGRVVPDKSEHFPPEVKVALIRAAATPIDGDPLARSKAINEVIHLARIKYPEYFRTDAESFE